MFYNFVFITIGLVLVFLSYVFMKIGTYVGRSDDKDRKTLNNKNLNKIVDPFGIYGSTALPIMLTLMMLAFVLFVSGIAAIFIGISSVLRTLSAS